MPTRIIMKPEGINESNLLETIREQSVGTIAPTIPALIVRTHDRRRLNNYLSNSGDSVEKIESEHETKLSKVDYAFIASTFIGLKFGLGCPFLTRFFLRRRGIEPVALYEVDTDDYNSFRKIREY